MAEQNNEMAGARILPDLQASIPCEDVRQEANGNFIIIGVINAIRAPKLPITALKLCIYNRWTAGLGQFSQRVAVLAPDQTTVLRESQARFQLQDASHHVTNVSVFQQLQFTEAGVHYVEVQVDDVMKIRYPVVISYKPPPSKQSGESGTSQSGSS